MKKVILQIDLENGNFYVEAHGFEGRTCDSVLQEVLDDIEAPKVTYTTQSTVTQEQKTKEALEVENILL